MYMHTYLVHVYMAKHMHNSIVCVHVHVYNICSAVQVYMCIGWVSCLTHAQHVTGGISRKTV